MTAFARELLCEVIQEVQPLLLAHHEEVALDQHAVMLDPQWDQYALLERMERFVVFTVREDGKLVGYAAFFVHRHMHYGAFTVAHCDVLFLHPQFRRGTTALRFIDFCEEQLATLGAQKIVFFVKLSLDWRPILHRKNYRDEEIMCGKLL